MMREIDLKENTFSSEIETRLDQLFLEEVSEEIEYINIMKNLEKALSKIFEVCDK